MKRIISGIVLSVIIVQTPFLYAQQTDDEYEPYEESEFPQWALDLRRAEVVFFGAIPLTILGSTVAYEGFRALKSLVHQGTAIGGSEFGSYDDTEKKWLLISGVGLAIGVSIADFIIEKLFRDDTEDENGDTVESGSREDRTEPESE